MMWSRWVPHELVAKQKDLLVNISSEHFQTYKNNPDILGRIISVDETCLKDMAQDILKVHVNGSYLPNTVIILI